MIRKGWCGSTWEPSPEHGERHKEGTGKMEDLGHRDFEYIVLQASDTKNST